MSPISAFAVAFLIVSIITHFKTSTFSWEFWEQAASAHEFSDTTGGVVMSDFDTNNDGLVSAIELAKQWDWTEEEAQDRIDDFDKDLDGHINAHEAADLMTKIEAHMAH